jgi:preprotein translocase subunit SecG
MNAMLWLLAVLFMVASLALGATTELDDESEGGTRTVYHPGDER